MGDPKSNFDFDETMRKWERFNCLGWLVLLPILVFVFSYMNCRKSAALEDSRARSAAEKAQ